jgi:hypothetical protein
MDRSTVWLLAHQMPALGLCGYSTKTCHLGNFSFLLGNSLPARGLEEKEVRRGLFFKV